MWISNILWFCWTVIQEHFITVSLIGSVSLSQYYWCWSNLLSISSTSCPLVLWSHYGRCFLARTMFICKGFDAYIRCHYSFTIGHSDYCWSKGNRKLKNKLYYFMEYSFLPIDCRYLEKHIDFSIYCQIYTEKKCRALIVFSICVPEVSEDALWNVWISNARLNLIFS